MTIGMETVFVAFSRFGLTVPGRGAEVQSMWEVLHNWKYEGVVKINIEWRMATIELVSGIIYPGALWKTKKVKFTRE
jgi:hypothetical protein